MKSYGIDKRITVNSTEEFHLEEFNNLGYTIINEVIGESDLKEIRTELDRIYSIQENNFGKNKLKEINEEYLVRMPLAYSNLFVDLASKKNLMNYVEKILGNFYVLHLQNGIINMPNETHHQSSWHRDLPYQNWTSSEPLACNLYFCIDDFNSLTGATYLLPFSHQFQLAPSIQYMEKNAIQIEAKAGSVILFNSMLFHKAGYNSSVDNIRRGINHVYVKPIINQQIDLPSLLKGKFAMTLFLICCSVIEQNLL